MLALNTKIFKSVNFFYSINNPTSRFLIDRCVFTYSIIGLNGSCSVHEWTGPFKSETVNFKMTSVCGHVMSLDFNGKYNNWDKVDPVSGNDLNHWENSFILFFTAWYNSCVKFLNFSFLPYILGGIVFLSDGEERSRSKIEDTLFFS